jgi:hypothetical protein
MGVTPEHYRAARLGIPRLPLPAILGFTLLGIGGSIFLSYTRFNHGPAKSSATPSTDARVYEARAVPFDSRSEDPAQRAASIARALAATQAELRRAATAEPEPNSGLSQPILLADSDRQLKGFDGFGDFSGSNSYLKLTGTSFGFTAQSSPSGFFAPDAETLASSPVPEASTWLFGAALFILVGARGMRARLLRNRRRN